MGESAEVDNQLPLFNSHFLIGMEDRHAEQFHCEAFISRTPLQRGPRGEDSLSLVTQLGSRRATNWNAPRCPAAEIPLRKKPKCTEEKIILSCNAVHTGETEDVHILAGGSYIMYAIFHGQNENSPNWACLLWQGTTCVIKDAIRPFRDYEDERKSRGVSHHGGCEGFHVSELLSTVGMRD